MNLRLHITLLFFLAAASCFAQDIIVTPRPEPLQYEDTTFIPTPGYEPGKPVFRFGAVLGACTTTADAGTKPTILQSESGFGFIGGAAANLRFTRREDIDRWWPGQLGCQVEMLYAMRSFEDYGTTFKLDCLLEPVLLQWWFARHFCLSGGPAFCQMLRSSPKNISYGGKIKGGDVMLAVGAEFQGRQGLTASIRYYKGNSKLAEGRVVKANSFAVSLGWLFGGNRRQNIHKHSER